MKRTPCCYYTTKASWIYVEEKACSWIGCLYNFCDTYIFFDISYFDFIQLLQKARGIYKSVLFRLRRLAFVVLRCEGNCRTLPYVYTQVIESELHQWLHVASDLHVSVSGPEYKASCVVLNNCSEKPSCWIWSDFVILVANGVHQQ